MTLLTGSQVNDRCHLVYLFCVTRRVLRKCVKVMVTWFEIFTRDCKSVLARDIPHNTFK